MSDTALNAERRAREWAELEAGHRPDLLVIGGGVTGAGIALDAAARGLDVTLIDAHDLAFGTSRWSSKLAHGGLATSALPCGRPANAARSWRSPPRTWSGRCRRWCRSTIRSRRRA